jgi:hypothetical protein
MGIKQKIEANPFFYLITIAISTFIAGAGVVIFIYNRIDKDKDAGFDLVAKNTYTPNKELNKNYIDINQYNTILSQYK